MSELWAQCLASEDDVLIASLQLQRVSVSKQTGEMTILFESNRIFSPSEVKRLQKRFASQFPDQGIALDFQYTSMKEQVLGNASLAYPALIERIKQHSPAAKSFFHPTGEDWFFEGDMLVLGVNSAESANYLKYKKTDEYIADCMKRLFAIPCKVRVTVNGSDRERIRSIEEARAKEATLLAASTAKNVETEKPAAANDAIIGHVFQETAMPMDELDETTGRCCVCGEITALEIKDTRNPKFKILTMVLSDMRSSCKCKYFLGSKRGDADLKAIQAQVGTLSDALKEGKWVKARGSYRYDDFSHEMSLMINDLMPATKPVRKDTAPEKRVELHLHTNFSEMDATAACEDLIKQAAAWGHKAIAITDHGVVQAFPNAFTAAKKAGIRLIPGCEGYLIHDDNGIVKNANEEAIASSAYVVLDFETTGLRTNVDRIIEIGAVRFENGEEVGSFSELIDPQVPLDEKVTEITGITSAMLAGQRTIAEVLPEFMRFCENAVLVAHNAAFDISFLRRACAAEGILFDPVVVDTLPFARCQMPQAKNHKLGALCKALNIHLANAHRAVHDARATAQLLMKLFEMVQAEHSVTLLRELNTCYDVSASQQAYHIVLLAMTQTGMTNLYRLVSEAHLNYFHRTPRIPKSLIEKYREGLIIGSACESGELFRAILNEEKPETIEEIARFYDYLEVQPIANNAFLVREGSVADEEGLRALNRKVVTLGEKLNIPVCATGDVHFLNPTDAIFRAILLASKGFDDADYQPPLYFKTTDEMLREFSYLGAEKAKEIVVTNPNRFAEMLQDVKVFLPHPEGKETFQPFWPEAEGELRALVTGKARQIYGDPLPEIVQKRVDKELNAIIGYGFSTLYMIAVKLVAKSLRDGYIVGSRGSVGSSLAAFLSGITEVNSLPPHYVCPKCKHSEFDVPAQYSTGLDLPVKDCPICGARMDKDGFNIPFEVFLGFKGDKVPDIDLNFSGEYQSTAHNYIKELFGAEYCYRAGTITNVMDKTAYGYVLKYAEERNLTLNNVEKERLARGITGVKRSTGQHPAGIVVLPKEYEIYQFTPIQHPANDMDSDITTHFNFKSMHDVLVKLDVLGHDDPTMLRKLQDITGIAPQAVPLHDPDVFGKIISLFSSPVALGLTAEELGVSESGTLGIPEFGTPFVRNLLKETNPTTMEELIRISGLSHGTAVWVGNAQDLVHQGVPLRECICTRDDIMNQLISYGVKPETAFKTMERVRKGKGLEEYMEKAILEVDTPPWFIDCCKKIQYMFPKAHAVAYVTMALRIAYFKVFHPAAYYCCYLARNAESFDGSRMTERDVDRLRDMIRAIESLEDNEKSRKDGELSLLQILVEMNLRGVHMKKVDIYHSRATDYYIDDDGEIVPPINSLPGLGASAAEQYCLQREGEKFISVDDMLRRKVAKSVIETFRQSGCLGNMPETSQVSLFEL